MKPTDTGWPADEELPADQRPRWLRLREKSGVEITDKYVEFQLNRGPVR